MEFAANRLPAATRLYSDCTYRNQDSSLSLPTRRGDAMKQVVALIAFALVSCSANAGELGFVEDFALAKDRAEALKKLIPGTEDYYYYHALHFLNTEQYEKVDALVKPWLERFGQTGRLTEIQTRQALLTYERNPQKSLDYLRNRLGLRFDHQKVVLGGAPNLPTALD